MGGGVSYPLPDLNVDFFSANYKNIQHVMKKVFWKSHFAVLYIFGSPLYFTPYLGKPQKKSYLEHLFEYGN